MSNFFKCGFHVIKRTVQGFINHKATILASAIAYNALFSIFPLLLGAIVLTSFFVSRQQVEDAIFSLVGPRFPLNQTMIRDVIDGAIAGRGAAGGIAIASLLWSGSNVFGTIITAVNLSWGVKKGRSFFASLGMQFGLLLVVGLLLLLSLGITAVIRVLASTPIAIGGFAIFNNPLFNALISLLPLVINFLTFFVIYKVAPIPRVPSQAAALGAVVGAALFEAAKYGLVVYMVNFTNFNAVYGSIAGVIVLLLWAYFSAVILLFGAELTRAYEIVVWRQPEAEGREAAEKKEVEKEKKVA